MSCGVGPFDRHVSPFNDINGQAVSRTSIACWMVVLPDCTMRPFWGEMRDVNPTRNKSFLPRAGGSIVLKFVCILTFMMETLCSYGTLNTWKSVQYIPTLLSWNRICWCLAKAISYYPLKPFKVWRVVVPVVGRIGYQTVVSYSWNFPNLLKLFLVPCTFKIWFKNWGSTSLFSS